ncbi:chromate transporter [Anaerofilum sp. BX8]|uniref:Chromate transporter n=1 Tax=Anaerofilum hominis TaxID=2763016 RepID=A0A923I8C9_9FIRM|nr:chromate transporter [Anaerofilum hominis]
MIYLQLFYEFFKAGLFAVGGGLATLPFLYDISDATGWFTHAQLADMVAISESTPGPIGINMSTYVGYTTGGIPGAVIATLGLITPSIIVILIVAGFLRAFKDNRYVKAAFYGLRPASTGLITAACWSLVVISLLRLDAFSSGGLLAVLNWKALLLAAVLLALTRIGKLKNLHPAAFLALSAVVGVVFRFGGA